MTFYSPNRDADRFKGWRIAVPYILQENPDAPERCHLATRIVDLYITQLMAEHKVTLKTKSNNNNLDDNTNDSEFS